MMPFASYVPNTVTIHDVGPFLGYAEKRGFGQDGDLSTQSTGCAQASAIITVSGMSKKDIVRVLGVSESKVKVAPCGVGSYVAAAPKPDLYRQHAPYFACMTARHFEAKNTSLAIKAWQIFRQRAGLPPRLLVGGGTSEEGRARLTEVGCEGDCKLLGFVPDESLSSFLHYAEESIIPSLLGGLWPASA
jgi:hypothetical protein